MAKGPSTSTSADKAIKKKKTKSGDSDKGYSTYIYKVFKTMFTDPENKVTIAAPAMVLLNNLVRDLEDRVSNQAFKLAKFENKSTLSAKHLQTATKLIFPRDMSGAAIGEGSKATTKFFA